VNRERGDTIDPVIAPAPRWWQKTKTQPIRDRLSVANFLLGANGLYQSKVIPGAFWHYLHSRSVGFRVTCIGLSCLLLVLMLSSIGLLVTALSGAQLWDPPMWPWFLTFGVLTLTTYGMIWHSHTEFRKAVNDMSGLICMRCGYVLKDLHDSGRCPECGEPYEFATLRREWGALLGCTLGSDTMDHGRSSA